MSMSEYVKPLLLMIENLLSGLWSVREFRKNYYDYYLEKVPDNQLSEKEIGFFGSLHEKLDWVDECPDDESRSVGWLDDQQFLEWVKIQKDKFSSD